MALIEIEMLATGLTVMAIGFTLITVMMHETGM